MPCPNNELTVFADIPASKHLVAKVCLKICGDNLGHSNSYPDFMVLFIE